MTPRQLELAAALGVLGLVGFLMSREFAPAPSADLEPLPDEFDPWLPALEGPYPVVTGGPPFPGGHNEWDDQILYVCNLYGMRDPLAPLLVKAIIEHESAHTWNPRIRGDRGACGPYRGDGYYDGWCSIGLMQVHRPSHPDLANAYDLRDGNENILAGGQVLAGAYRNWPDVSEVLQTYNGGATRNAQTANYAANVGATFRRFAQEVGIALG